MEVELARVDRLMTAGSPYESVEGGVDKVKKIKEIWRVCVIGLGGGWGG